MSNDELRQAIEALIFASGEPLATDKICDTLDCQADSVEKAIDEINSAYSASSGALRIVRLDDSWQITTKPEFAPQIRKMLEIQRNTPLSSAAFEVLAVVAYNQPVTKSFIEQVRGVDCSGVVSSLVEKGLIEEKGRLELPGRPLIYATTKQFLRCFGLSSLSDLPPLPEKNDVQADEAVISNDEAVSETVDEGALL